MQTVALTPTLTSTRVGFGCAGLMRESSQARRQQVLEAAFEQGIRHFDVARMYGLGAAEGELGRFARGRREQLVIATKFGIEAGAASGRLARFQGPARRLLARNPRLRAQVKRRSDTLHQPHRYDVATARASLERSLRELGTDHVDLFLLHGPTPHDTVEAADLCAYLEHARAAGQIRAWGVAGEREDSLQVARSLAAAAPDVPTVVQIRDDVLARATPPELGLSAPITFGVLAEALQRIRAHLDRDPARRARWSQAVGVDCASAEALAGLLLRDALARNEHGVVLIATTKPQRLAGVGALVETTGPKGDGEPATGSGHDGALGALRRLIREELLGGSGPAERREGEEIRSGGGHPEVHSDAA